MFGCTLMQGNGMIRIEYKVDLQMGDMYIEKDGFTYNLSDAKSKHGHDHQLEAHDQRKMKRFNPRCKIKVYWLKLERKCF